MHTHPSSPLAYIYLAAITAGTAAVCWFTRREMGRVRVAVAASPGPASSPSVRRTTVRDGTTLLALVDSMTAEAVERRRLLETHLREQLDAEHASKVEDALVEGFGIGYRARQAEEGGPRP